MKYIYYLFFSLFIGFLIAFMVNYNVKKTGHQLQEFILFINEDCYHIHHWIIFSLIVICILAGKYIKNNTIIYMIIGLLIGASLEDTLFKNVFKIKNHCHQHKIVKNIESRRKIKGF